MNLLHRIKAKLKPEPPAKPLLSETQDAELKAALAPAPLPPAKPKGRVIKQTRHAEFNPDPSRRGGRIVKVMPRQLQKIKEAQEKVEDDETPKVTDIED